MFKKVDPKVSFPKMEEEIIEFWEKEKVFEKSVLKEAPKGDFVFYEGPPTANGRPGLHHVLARSFKDIIPRYKTMKGYRVVRKAGWDTHGLPVELQVEKALGLKNKQEIENWKGDKRTSIIEFNKKCKESVWEYRELWEKLTKRMGYWVDMEHPYVTYENSYIESVWWQLAQIAKLKNAKGESFLYKGHKVVPYCYRCGTALSSHEVAQGYKETTDNSVYVKFKAVPEQKIGDFTTDDKTYFLAWTTTPWTLPGNVALAVKNEEQYFIGKVKTSEVANFRAGETYIFARAADKNIFRDNLAPVPSHEGDLSRMGVNYRGKGNVIFENVYVYPGKAFLASQAYEGLFDAGESIISKPDKDRLYKIVSDQFVTSDSGTGIVHIAPAFGEDDARLGQEWALPTLLTVYADGTMEDGFPGEGIPVKKMNDKNRYAVDDLIIENLEERGLLFAQEPYTHEYPFCWRCDTPLIYYAKPSWFIRMSELREELAKGNESINWVPGHIKDGRFGEWLRGVKDWAISRERYWGTPLPIWECRFKRIAENKVQLGCGKVEIISSLGELEKKSGKKIEDVHKPYVDDLTWKCECGGVMERVPEVLDVWFDSGAMPLAQFGYPSSASSEEKKNIEAEKTFPADYICEAIDQTRGWFYTLHAVANLLARAGVVSEGRAYKNVICLGHILDSKGKKMSKSKGNVIDPFEMFDQYGADALRWLLFSLNQPGLPKRFDVKGMRDVQNRVFRMLWNSYLFFITYVSIDRWNPKTDAKTSENLLDRWILSELQMLVKDVDARLENYDVYGSTATVETFIDHLSNWYIRRSRKRFWKNENDTDKEQAYQTLYDVLVILSKLLAPFTPFVAEEIYRNLTGEESVHLENFPVADEELIDERLNENMRLLREVVTLSLQERAKAKIKVRQPLKELALGKKYASLFLDEAVLKRNLFTDILGEEVNVQYIRFLESQEEDVWLDTNITEELRLEGEAREIIRAVQEGRKKAGFNVEDRIVLGYFGKETVFNGDTKNDVSGFKDMIAREVLATEVMSGEITDAEYMEEAKIEGEAFRFWLKRV